MAEINLYGERNKGIQAPAPDEQYIHEIDVRPLKKLVENDYSINLELQSLVPKKPVEIPDGKTSRFTLPNEEKAIPGSLFVYLNGIMYNPRNILLSSDGKSFSIINGDILPDKNDSFYIVYRIANKIFNFEKNIPINPNALVYKGFIFDDNSMPFLNIVPSTIKFHINERFILKDIPEENSNSSKGRIFFKDDDGSDIMKAIGTINYKTSEYEINIDLRLFLKSGETIQSSIFKVFCVYRIS